MTALILSLPWYFWEKVLVEDRGHETPCLTWTACKTSNGYGQVRISKVNHLAHRVTYETLIGPVPADRQLDHLCRNRACVNVSHLEVVTQRENLMRGLTRTAANAAKTHCPQGHEYIPENLMKYKNGWRICRACHRDRMHRRYQERKRKEQGT